MSQSSIRLRPERFIAGGEALGHDGDGRVVFVRGGLPGEAVSGPVVESKKDWVRIDVDQVHEASPNRVIPPCPQRLAGCGGCDWQHIEPSAQLQAKAEVVADAMARTARLPEADIQLGTSVPARGYRTTLRLIGDQEGRPSYRRERSHETVPAVGCLISHPTLRQLLDVIEMSPGIELSLRVSQATGELTALWDPRKGDVTGLPAGTATGPKSHITEQVAGHHFKVSAASFFQSGPAAAELLVASVRRAAPELKTASAVVDAYAGVGLFAVAAVPAAARVVAIERSRSSASDCASNLADRDGSVVRVDVSRWRSDGAENVDVVVADPSRSGLQSGGVDALVAARSPVMVLVSCDPVSMARDAKLLGEAGYRHDRTEVLDLFPHTHHVECVTRFVQD